MGALNTKILDLVKSTIGFTTAVQNTNDNANVQIRKIDKDVLIIGSAWGRTGTSSLQLALQILGYPCYHMRENFKNNDWEIWTQLGAEKMAMKQKNIDNGETETPWNNTMVDHDWDKVFKNRGYTAHCDEPTCAFYKELMAYYPKYKVIHNVRDAEKWYDSAISTIMKANLILHERFFYRLFFSNKQKVYWYCVGNYLFDGRVRDKEFVIKRYNDWNNEVINYVPEDRLLLLDLKKGWKPLCDFLEIDEIPNIPFPHSNEREIFNSICWKLNLLADVVNVGLIITPCIVAYYYRDTQIMKDIWNFVLSIGSK